MVISTRSPAVHPAEKHITDVAGLLGRRWGCLREEVTSGGVSGNGPPLYDRRLLVTFHVFQSQEN